MKFLNEILLFPLKSTLKSPAFKPTFILSLIIFEVANVTPINVKTITITSIAIINFFVI